MINISVVGTNPFAVLVVKFKHLVHFLNGKGNGTGPSIMFYWK